MTEATLEQLCDRAPRVRAPRRLGCFGRLSEMLAAGAWCSFALCLLGTAPARAQEAARSPDSFVEAAELDASELSRRSWAIGLGAQRDDGSGHSELATFDWNVSGATWLSFSTGRSVSPADRASVTADTLTAGVEHRFGLLGIAFEAERWGDADALESSDLRGSAYLQTERWSVALAFERREIDIPFTIVGPLDRPVTRTAELSGQARALRARVQPAPRWQLYLSAANYDYDRDLNALPRIDRLNALSASTLTLANSFLDYERTVGIERELGQSLLSLTLFRDRSAVDGSRFEGGALGLLFPVSRRVDLEVTLGRGESDVFSGGTYGGLLLLIYGG